MCFIMVGAFNKKAKKRTLTTKEKRINDIALAKSFTNFIINNTSIGNSLSIVMECSKPTNFFETNQKVIK